MTSSRTSLLSVPSCLVVGAAVLVGGADTVAVPEEVCRVPVVLDLQETRVAVAPVPETWREKNVSDQMRRRDSSYPTSSFPERRAS